MPPGPRVSDALRRRLIQAFADTSLEADAVSVARARAARVAPAELVKRLPETTREAAVLLPVLDQPELPVVFTRRTDDLPTHAGQVSFPGGRLEAGDADAEAAALRETEEEIGVPATAVRVLGYLPPYLTVTGYSVTPVVGLVTPGFVYRPQAAEVAEIFEVPLAYLLNRANYRVEYREMHGARIGYHVVEYENHRIWGATAGMLAAFRRRLEAAIRDTGKQDS